MTTTFRYAIVGSRELESRVRTRLQRAGLHATGRRVATDAQCRACFAAEVDLILADFAPRKFGAVHVLDLVRSAGVDIPVIVLGTRIGEDAVARCMRLGAADYVRKNQLTRLAEAVGEVLRQRRSHTVRRRTGAVRRPTAVDTDSATRLRHADAALADALSERENMMETIPDVLYRVAPDGTLQKWNRKLETITGLRPEQIEGRSALEFFVEEDRPSVAEAIRLAFVTGYGEVEACMLHHDGGVVPYHFTGVPLRDGQGNLIGLTGVGRDITERRRAEAELQRLTAQVEQQARTLDGILSVSPDHVYMFDRAGRYTYASQAGARALGVERCDIVGRTSKEIGLPPKLVGPAAVQRARVFATGESMSGATRLPTVQGIRDFDYTLSPILSADGGVEAVVATARDVTEHIQAQRRTAVLLEVATDICGTLDLTEIFSRVLRRTAEALPCDGVAVFHVDRLRGVTRMIAQHGVAGDLLAAAEALTFPPDGPFEGRIGRGETLVINNMTQQAWLPSDLYRQFGLAALVVAPLNVRGRGLGALVAFNNEPGQPFHADQTELFRGITGQLAVAMESIELYRVQQEEAAVSAALARVGREMIALLDTPVLLQRLCQLTTEVLGCDYSHIWLLHPDEKAYVPASAHGDPPEHWEALRTVKLPREMLGVLLERLDRDGAVNTNMSVFGTDALAAMPSQYGITVSMMLPLRRGGEIVGLYTAGYRGRQEPFSSPQERIARGIAQLGSLALDSARLFEELERANRLKSDFVATMSHELRTPLHIIMGYTELLQDGAFGPVNSEQTDALVRTDRNARALLDLITATLDMNRLESGRLQAELGEVALSELIREIDTEVRELLRQKPAIHFAWDAARPLPPLYSDATKLKVVLKNLINNAFKFTDEGSIVVYVRPSDGGVAFRVVDTGIGIPTAAQPVIFEAFRQGDSSSTRRYGGVGLGLYIVRRLLDLLGGTITVESAPGCGSTFHVWLPAMTASEVSDRTMTAAAAGSAG